MYDADVVLVSLDSNEERLIQKIVEAMDRTGVKRLLFLTSIGIYNEIPITTGASGNLTEKSILMPYEQVIDVIENSDLNYTIIRPSNFDNGQDVDDYVLVHNGGPAAGEHVSIASVAHFIVDLTHNKDLASHDNVAISRKN